MAKQGAGPQPSPSNANQQTNGTTQQSPAPSLSRSGSQSQLNVGQGTQPNNPTLQLQQSLGNQATLQLVGKPARINSLMGAHMRAYTEETDAGQTTYTVDEATKKGSKLKRNDELEDLQIQDKSGEWSMVRVGQEKGFLRKSKISAHSMSSTRDDLKTQTQNAATTANATNTGATQTPEEDDDDEDGFMENTGEVIEMLMAGPDGVSDSWEEQIEGLEEAGNTADKEVLEHKSSILGVASAPVGVAGSVFEGLIGLKKILKSANDDTKSTGEKALDVTEGVIDTASGVNGVIEGVSGLVKDAGALDGKELSKAEGVSDWSGSVGEAISAIKSAFFAVKDIYDLVEKGLSEEGLSLDEAVEGGLSTVHNLLDAAKGAVETAISIKKILEAGTGELSKVVPGLGIAVSGISIAIKVYNMIKANVSRQEMTTIKRSFKEKYKTSGYTKENNYSIFGINLHSSTGTDAQKLEARITELTNKQDRTEAEEQELNDISDYKLAKELKNNNNKTLVRGTIQVGLEMANIAGEIATLSGVGAQVGIPLKAAVSGVGLSMSVIRKAKQAGRDYAAKHSDSGIMNSIFDASKSTDKKKARRDTDAGLIMDMIENLPEYKVGDRKIQEQYARVEKYIAATGTGLNEFYRLNGDTKKQRDLLAKNMAKRE